MSKNDFRKGLLENAKKVKGVVGTSHEDDLTPGEKYILERKKKPVTEELTLGQRLLQERYAQPPTIITESVETPVVSEDVKETAQMISEVSEAIPEQRGRRVTPDTEDGRLLEYIDTIKSTTETSHQKSLIEQDLQNTAATMADLANLRSVVTRLQTSLTSLGGGGIGYQEVMNLIEDNSTNLDSADLKYIADQIDNEFIDSEGVLLLINERVPQIVDSAYVNALIEASDIDSDHVVGIINDTIDSAYFNANFSAKTTDDLTQGAIHKYYDSSLFDGNFASKTTDDLSQGLANKYYDSSLFNADFALKSTDDLGEGSQNLYYTDARVTAHVDSAYVQARVSLEAGVHFKGVVNFATDSAPEDPSAGDMYIADSDAVANASWLGIAGETILAQHGVIWANLDSSWHEVGSTSVDASVYVEKSGDTMTGTLSLESGNLVVEEGNVTIEEGDIVTQDFDAGVFTNNIHNASVSTYVKIHKDGALKAAFKEQEIVSYQPHIYPNNIASHIDSAGTDQTLIHKGYVDARIIKNSGTTALKGNTTIDGASGKQLKYKGPASGIGFNIARDTGIIMFYQEDGDIRLNNTNFNSDYSVVNRKKGDERYVQIEGDTMTGDLSIPNHDLITNTIRSNGNSNIYIKRDNGTKILISSTHNTNYQKAKYNNDYGVTDDMDIPHKKYVDDAVAAAGGSAKTWPGRRFKFTGYGQGTGVPLTHFSPSADTNSISMFMSVQCYDNIRINQGSPDYTPGVTMTLSLFTNSSGTWRQIGLGTFGGAETDYRGNYIRLNGFTWKQKPSLGVGATYAIVVSSMWG